MGLLFSPPLAGIICLKMFLTFYIKKFCVINFCRAPSKLWRSHQTHTLFAILMFLSLLGVVVAHIYIITQLVD
jgi:transmembrane channel-like protein